MPTKWIYLTSFNTDSSISRKTTLRETGKTNNTRGRGHYPCSGPPFPSLYSLRILLWKRYSSPAASLLLRTQEKHCHKTRPRKNNTVAVFSRPDINIASKNDLVPMALPTTETQPPSPCLLLVSCLSWCGTNPIEWSHLARYQTQKWEGQHRRRRHPQQINMTNNNKPSTSNKTIIIQSVSDVLMIV